jgi:hypothetical protein
MSGIANATPRPPLWARVLARKDQLEDALADVSPHDAVTRTAIETALAGVYALITGDLAHPPGVVSHALADWLERNKYL